MMNNKTETFVTTVAFVGRPNAGKSTLLNALVGTKIAPTSHKPQTTRRTIRGIKTKDGFQQIYLDTPGISRNISGLDAFMQDQISQAILGVDQVVAIVDANDATKKHLPFLLKIKAIADQEQQRFILVINKIDALKDKSTLLGLIAEYASALKADEIVPISAMNNDGIDELFDLLSRSAQAAEFLFDEDLFTDASEKEIVAELIREKAMLELSEELPYRLAVTIENFDESRRQEEKKPLIMIDAVLHVERKSQKAIVIGKGGRALKAIGVRARKDIENLLQCQVMLKLFVRVEPNWTTSMKSLRKLGFGSTAKNQ